jgi:hypothetical protein
MSEGFAEPISPTGVEEGESRKKAFLQVLSHTFSPERWYTYVAHWRRKWIFFRIYVRPSDPGNYSAFIANV